MDDIKIFSKKEKKLEIRIKFLEHATKIWNGI